MNKKSNLSAYRGSPPYTDFGTEKTTLHKIHISGTVGGPLLPRKSPTCAYISQKIAVVKTA